MCHCLSPFPMQKHSRQCCGVGLPFGHMESTEKAREEPQLLCYLLSGSGSPLG